MQNFKADRKLYRLNEIKSWLWIIFVAALLYFVFLLFFPTAHSNLIIGLFVFLLLKAGNMLTQSHVSEIIVDKEKNQLIFVLKSLMTGEKTIKYALQPAGSELIYISGLKSLFSSPITLIIYLPYKDKFRIGNRYGFSVEMLTAINNTFKSLNNSQQNLPE